MKKLSAQYLSKLSQSEQRLVIVGGALVLVALVWVFIYKPVTTHINNQVKVKQRLTAQVAQMQTISGSLGSITPTTQLSIPDGVTFSTWIDQQLRSVNLQDKVNRTEPIDNNSLSLWLQGVPFDQVIDWLQVISKNYSVQVDQIDINVVDPTLGLTNIRMRLVK